MCTPARLVMVCLALLTAVFMPPGAARAQFSYTTNDGTLTITAYTGSGGKVTVPATANGLPVTTIGSWAFSGGGSGVTSVLLPDTVTTIADLAFAGAPIADVPSGKALSVIGNQAFFDCRQLTNAALPDSLRTIGGGAFMNCYDLLRITIPSGVTNIGNWAFRSCRSLASVTIPDGITVIGDGTFADCESLTNAVIPESVTSFGDSAFDGAGLRSITIPSGVTTIGDHALCCGLTSVTIPGSVGAIGDYAFEGTGLTNLVISEGVGSIGEYAFASCYSLASLTIPRSVTNIGSYAFTACRSLVSVYFQGNVPRGDWTVFANDGGAIGLWPPPLPILYYLPGNSPPGITFGTLPVVLWDPSILVGGALAVPTNGFGFTITGSSDFTVVVEASTNLASPAWVPLSTNTLSSGASNLTDPDWTNHTSRFYRLRSP